MDIKFSKSNVIWSYIAQFFNIGAGFITLPLVLHLLTTEEIAMNYLMLTVGSMVALIDFGFAPQFGRYVTYVFSGAQSLQKDGLNNDIGESINYHLLKNLIDVAKYVYRVMSIIVLVIMLTFGTWYISKVTDGFTNVENSFLIWITYSISVYFNIYFYYYTSLLTGRGMIMESKKATMASRITYIVISCLLLLCGFGLIGPCIASLISPFIARWMQYRWFYDSDLKGLLHNEATSKEEKLELFRVIWYNAKKLGLNFIGAYAMLKFSMFVVGIYLVAAEISSYGLMMQLVTIIVSLSSTLFYTLIPSLTSYRVESNKQKLIVSFAFSLVVFFLIYILLSIGLIMLGPWALDLIKSNAKLPSNNILILYLLVMLLENNHSIFATIIATGNKVPYVKSALVSGFVICLGDVLVLKYTNFGLLGVIIVQGLVQLAYNNWYWPKWVCNEYSISFSRIIYIGIQESYGKLLQLFNKYR